MGFPILIGQTDYTKLIFIRDPASTDGGGKTGLVAANLTVSYTRIETDNDAVLTDATSSLNNLASLTAAHNDWGIIEISSSLAPGLYRLDFADAVFATGAWTAVVYIMITTSAAAPAPLEFDLVVDAGATLNAILAAVDPAIADINTRLPALPAAEGSAMTLTSGERNSTAAALLDLANGIETGKTVRESMRLMLSVLAGKISGAVAGSAGTITIRNTPDTKSRVVASVDANGNRTSVTLDTT